MTAEEIVTIITVVIGCITIIALTFLFLKYAFPLLLKQEEKDCERAITKARAEIRLLKKQLKLYAQEVELLENEREELRNQLARAEKQIDLQEQEYIELKKLLADIEQTDKEVTDVEQVFDKD